MDKKDELENSFLKKLSAEQVPVSVFLVNGIKLHGMILDFDLHVVMLKNSVIQMVYKNAISTIVPSRVVQSNSNEQTSNTTN